jgi:hypothetical protein
VTRHAWPIGFHPRTTAAVEACRPLCHYPLTNHARLWRHQVTWMETTSMDRLGRFNQRYYCNLVMKDLRFNSFQTVPAPRSKHCVHVSCRCGCDVRRVWEQAVPRVLDVSIMRAGWRHARGHKRLELSRHLIAYELRPFDPLPLHATILEPHLHLHATTSK